MRCGCGGVRERHEFARSRRARRPAASSALNADGSNLKASSPLAIAPAVRIRPTSASTPTLAARAGAGRMGPAALAQRFQVADSDSFSNIVASGMGVTDASGVTRYTVDPALTAGKRYVWRLRARNERRVRAVVERDGLHDRAAAGATPVAPGGPTCDRSAPAGSGAGDAPAVARHVWDVLAALLGRSRFVPARPQVRQQPVAGPRHRCVPPGRLALGLQRQADPHRRRQQRRARRRPPATKRRITTAAGRIRDRRMCTSSTCSADIAARRRRSRGACSRVKSRASGPAQAGSRS